MYRPRIHITRTDLRYVPADAPDTVVEGTSWSHKCSKGHFLCRPCGQYTYNNWVDRVMEVDQEDDCITCPSCVHEANPDVFSNELRTKFFTVPKLKKDQKNPLTIFSKKLATRAKALTAEVSGNGVRAEMEAVLQKERAIHVEHLRRLHDGNTMEIDMAPFQSHAKRELEGDICTDRCPHCNIAANQVNGCMAVTCMVDESFGFARRKDPGCGMFFCGFCFEKAETFKLCHDHVKRCPENWNEAELFYGRPPADGRPAERDYFVPEKDHLRHRQRRSAERILRRIQGEPEGLYKIALMEHFEEHTRCLL
ncbi:hypothetical protein CYMTET_49861 [Cymbomonas tetramitiformis]|uniref:Uncharacterized protein n=1 Tax=Cymbomonas tetramitiformis TaxID=36881 RepID=A0AAE0BPF5_9CHLO|nr:hypothetical protein CYMTET_49861 [Cymbomonas tetramitiformis]